MRDLYILPSLPETDSIRLYHVPHEINIKPIRRDGLNPSQSRRSGNEKAGFIYIALITGDGFNPSRLRRSGNENLGFIYIALITGDGFNPSLPLQHPADHGTIPPLTKDLE